MNKSSMCRRYILNISLLVALLLSGSLEAVRRSHVLEFKIFNSGEMSPIIKSVTDAIANINETIIKPNNNAQWEAFNATLEAEKKKQQEMKQKNIEYTYSVAQPRRPNVTFYPQIASSPGNYFHMTLMDIGYLDDTHPNYNTIMDNVKKGVKEAIAAWMKSGQCQQLDFSVGDLMWPPLGFDKKIWLGLAVKPAEKVRDSLLILLNLIRGKIETIQNQYKCFEDKLYQPKKYPQYTKLAEASDVGALHISIGRIDPAYEVFNYRMKKGNVEKVVSVKDVKQSIDDGYALVLDEKGKPSAEKDETKYLLKGLNQQEIQEFMNKLPFRTLKLNNPNFTMTHCTFVSGDLEARPRQLTPLQDFDIKCVSIEEAKPPVSEPAPLQALKQKQEEIAEQQLKKAQEALSKAQKQE